MKRILDWPARAAWMNALLFVPAPLPVLAQDAADEDEDEVRGERVVIEVDGEGRVTVDGKPFSDEDGPVILRVRPDGGTVEVERVGPNNFRFRDGFTVVHPNDGEAFHLRRSDWPRMEDLEIDIPDIPDFDVEPFIRNFRFDFDGPRRFRISEHREVAELEKQSREIAREARRAEGQERADLEADLRAKLNEIFDKKTELRREHVEKLDENLEEERETLQKREESREQMIDRRQRMLMGEGDALDW
jgi:hypothetical protein